MERDWGLENAGSRSPSAGGVPEFLRPQRQPEEQTLQLGTFGSESAFISPDEGEGGDSPRGKVVPVRGSLGPPPASVWPERKR